MAIPKYDEFYNVYLESIRDGSIHTVTSCQEYIRDKLRLSIEDISEKSSSGAYRWVGRVNWAALDLKDAGAIVYPKQGYVQITQFGLKLLAQNVKITKRMLSASAAAKSPDKTQQNAEEKFNAYYKEVTMKLAAELSKLLFDMDAKKFDSFVLNLLARMGYNVGKVAEPLRDSGVCGLVYSDKLGFDKVAVYAKHFAATSNISKIDIQRFVVALQNNSTITKGLFVTTAKFAPDAIKFAGEQNIVLIDGRKLTELMFEYDFGVLPQKIYKVKSVDKDFEFWE